MRRSLIAGVVCFVVASVCGAVQAADCKPGVLKLDGTCDCPAGFVSKGEPGEATCKPSNVVKPGGGASGGAAGSGASTKLKCPTGMIAIAGGSFVDSLGKATTVTELCVDKTEVTVAAYSACVDAGDCTAPKPYDDSSSWKFQRACNWKHPDGRAKHPVNCLTFGQAKDYCASKKGRLPTESEWEWIARGRSKGNVFPWGATDPTDKLANGCGEECVSHVATTYNASFKTELALTDPFGESAPVGSFPKGASADGVLDLAGNVAELTLSWYDANGNVAVRGGGWEDGRAVQLRVSGREKLSQTDESPAIGFRCIVSKDVKTMPALPKKAPGLGSRVGRGPDWKWGDQGNGKNGTVITEMDKDGWVEVQWDNGYRNDYRWGVDGAYDLIVLPGLLPQACDKSGSTGTVSVGTKVILGKHRAVGGDDNWASKMTDYVGKTGTVTKTGMYDKAGCATVRVDVDSGSYVWRVRDLGLP